MEDLADGTAQKQYIRIAKVELSFYFFFIFIFIDLFFYLETRVRD